MFLTMRYLFLVSEEQGGGHSISTTPAASQRRSGMPAGISERISARHSQNSSKHPALPVIHPSCPLPGEQDLGADIQHQAVGGRGFWR